MPYCTNCGAEVKEAARFCRKCGTAQGAPMPAGLGPSGEKTIYKDKTVVITTTRVTVSDASYTMANLTSVRIRAWRKINPLVVVFLFASLFGLWAGSWLRSSLLGITGLRANSPACASLWVLLFVASALTAFVFILRGKPVYGVCLRLPSAGWLGWWRWWGWWGAVGEERIMTTEDKDYAIKIANAINEAIIERG